MFVVHIYINFLVEYVERKCTPNEKITIDCKKCRCIKKGTGFKCKEPKKCSKQKIAKPKNASNHTLENDDGWNDLEELFVHF